MWMQKLRQKTKEWPIILPVEGKRNRQEETNKNKFKMNKQIVIQMRRKIDRQNEVTSYFRQKNKKKD